MVKKTKTKKKQKTERPLRKEKETLTISKEKLSAIAYEWRATFDAIKDAISFIDVEGKIIRCNKAMSNILGKPFEEIIGRTCWELMHGSTQPIPECSIVRMKISLKRETMILPIGERVFEVTADPLLDDSGKLKASVHIISDITYRIRVAEVLGDCEEKYKILTENSITGIFMHQDGRFVFVNEKFAEIHGYKPEELLGREYLELIHPDERDTMRELTLKRLKGESVHQRYEVRRIRKDGTTIWCEMMAALILYKGRTAIMGNIIDITGRRKTEEDLKKSYEENLLRQGSMLNLSEDLLKEVDERNQAEERIQIYHKRLSDLASQIALIEETERRHFADELHDVIGQNLALARIKLAELKDTKTDDETLNRLAVLSELIDEASRSTRSLTFELSPPILYEIGFEAAAEWLGDMILKRYDIAFHLEKDGQPKPLTEDTKVLLYLSLRELIVNIVKHAKALNATLSVRRQDDNIYVSVTDDGIGFDASDMDYQIMKAASFGLFSTRERLKRLGGRLEISSQPGRGTTVTMIAPLKE